MAIIIVTYQQRDMQRDAECEFADMLEAIRFADGCIEDGGHAHITTYGDPCANVTSPAKLIVALRQCLCDVYIGDE